jgi:hypothetical protein
MAGPRCRRRLISRILGAQSAGSTDGGEALLKSREPAIYGALFIERAPRIILSLGGGGEHRRRDCTEYEQRSHREARVIRGRCRLP